MRALVVGAGPAGLMAAEVFARAGVTVEVFDAAPSPLRKFLLAGRGGLNLTHAEPLDAFLGRYGEAGERMAPALSAFPPDALRAWAADLGEPTFVGSSGRVFPEGFKATRLARAWLRRLGELGVAYRPRRRLVALGDGVTFAGPEGRETHRADVVVLALGGASWPRLGGDGAWVEALASAGVEITPLTPANMGLNVGWSSVFAARVRGGAAEGGALDLRRRRLARRGRRHRDGARRRRDLRAVGGGARGGQRARSRPVDRRSQARPFGGGAGVQTFRRGEGVAFDPARQSWSVAGRYRAYAGGGRMAGRFGGDGGAGQGVPCRGHWICGA